MKTTASFSIPDEEMEYYNKYGKEAVEKGNSGEYEVAIKLFDKMLKKFPNSEFALVMKANFYFNLIASKESADLFPQPKNLKEVPKIRKFYVDYKNKLEKCISMLDKALEINSKNQGAIELKDYIMKNPMNEVLILLEKIDGISTQTKNISYGCKLICPYCRNEYTKMFGNKESDTKDDFIEVCPNCSKEFRVLVGKITLWRSRGTGVVSYGSPEYTIRIKNRIGNEQVLIFNSNYNLLHIKQGDEVCFTFKKKILSSQFSEKPFAILNATTNTYSLI